MYKYCYIRIGNRVGHTLRQVFIVIAGSMLQKAFMQRIFLGALFSFMCCHSPFLAQNKTRFEKANIQEGVLLAD